MGAPTKTIKDKTLEKWLTDFSKQTTRRVYASSIRKFKKNLGIKDLGEYIQSKPDATEDIKRFLVSLEGKPSKTIGSYVGAVKVFLTDHDIKIENNKWRKLRRRGFMPKRVIPETRDKSPTKKQLKTILNYLDIKGKALVLFLLSSGARIGEALRLEKKDFNLESDPPSVHIRGIYTKAGVGERTIYFSYEARDAIKDWLQVKETLKKRNGKSFDKERVFSWGKTNTNFMWNSACDKAGLGAIDENTNRRIYHIHSLRKFFRSKIGLDLDMTHALMGHTEYLDENYLRQEQDEIAEAYLEAMPNVSVYAVEDKELKRSVEQLKEENIELKSQLNGQRTQLSEVAELRGELDELRRSIRQMLQKKEE